LRAALQRALDSPRHCVARLSNAATTVTFGIAAFPELGATLLLDRRPCEVVDAEPAEVEVTLTVEQARLFAAGALPMTEAVVAGQVQHAGPIRRYLEVDPILRHLLAELGGEGARAEAVRGAGRSAGAIEPAVLAIETRGLHKHFGANAVLEDLNLTIPEGVISVVLGPSGTGKSVLLQHIIGLMKPDAGDVLIRGRALSGMSPSEVLAVRREIGVMFQDGALLSAMNVYDNVAFPLRQLTDLTEAEVRGVVEGHLASVGLANDGRRMPAQLSGGMRKRAGLARALVLDPAIVLCDEPDSGLDPVRTALLGDLIAQQHAEYGGTMVVVTHNVMLARRISDHISVLWRGRVLESGLAQEILASDTPFVRQFLAGAEEGPLGMDA
jgi:phospholipid/cholesterol/gamma-HCH transport system ATP-binding protein